MTENSPPQNQNDDLKFTPWLNPEISPMVQIKNVTKNFGDISAVNEVSLKVFPGELFTILGGSGSGKTTLLRMLAGFEQPSSGSIMIDGVDMTGVPPYERPVNMMFQSYALFPHMTVEQNVAYGLQKGGVGKAETKTRTSEILELVKMGHLAKRKPAALSGGESQRVALARALVKKPKLLLLDEPLAALDRKLREHTQFEIMNLQDELGITFMVVTHDQQEAMILSTRIVVMNQGRFEQVGTPGEVYEYPSNRFVADFIGKVNLMQAVVKTVEGELVTLECEEAGADLFTVVDAQNIPETGLKKWIAVRPEKIFISKQHPVGDGLTVLKGTVEDLGYFGNLSLYKVALANGKILQVSGQNRIRTATRTVEWDDEVFISWDNQSAVLLEA
jgi:putrescine transport system ATP-binding protein